MLHYRLLLHHLLVVHHRHHHQVDHNLVVGFQDHLLLD